VLIAEAMCSLEGSVLTRAAVLTGEAVCSMGRQSAHWGGSMHMAVNRQQRYARENVHAFFDK